MKQTFLLCDTKWLLYEVHSAALADHPGNNIARHNNEYIAAARELLVWMNETIETQLESQ